MIRFHDPRGWWLLMLWAIFFLVLARKIRRRKVVLTTLFLLRPLVEAMGVLRRRFRILRRLAFLSLVVAAFLVAVAGSVPILETGTPPRREVVVVDLSASLGVMEQGKPRMEGMRRLLLDYGRGLRPGDLVWLVTAGHRARVLPALSPGRELGLALAGLEHGDSLTDVEGALELASSIEGVERVLFFTDRPGRWSGEALASLPDTRFVTLGGRTENAGIAAFDLRRDPLGEASFDLYLKAGFWGAGIREETEVVVTLLNNGRRVETLRERCASGATVEFEARGLPLMPGVLEALLEPGGSYGADDRVLAAIPDEERLRVLAVTDGNAFLEEALTANAGLEVALVKPDDYRLEDPEAVFIFDGTVPDGDLPRRALFILPDREIRGVSMAGMRLADNVVEWDRSEPVMRGVQLDDLSLRVFLELEESPGFRVAATVDGYPLLLVSGGERLWAVLAFDPSETTFVYSAGYPMLVANLVRWLGMMADAEERFLTAGEMVRLPSTAAGGDLLFPNGEEWQIPAGETGAAVAAAGAGRYRVRGPGGDDLGEFFVNVLRADVSAEVAGEGYGVGPPALPADLKRGRASLALAPVAALLALVFLALESLLTRGQTSGREET